ncbi:MAG: transposase [Clostridia bacterium]
MWKLIDEVFIDFKKCFNRNATFEWFIVIVVGFMIRSDKLGVTSVIRDLDIASKSYTTMMHFFRSDAWKLQDLINTWVKIVKGIAPIYKEDGFTILVGDGVKQSKEARRMPGVKKLHQESENSSKAEYIFGHMFGGVGVLIGAFNTKMFCVPLSMKIHDGVKAIRKWHNSDKTEGSHVVQMVENGFDSAKIMGKSILLLDRYFLAATALIKLSELNKEHGRLLDIITKAKLSVVAYTKPLKNKGKGRPRKKGESIKLRNVFEDRKDDFIEDTIMLYGKEEKVKYLCLDLLWGQKLYQELRFVLVTYNDVKSILVSTNLEIDPKKVISLYSYRFKIECTFRELKQVVGGFSYQFWCKSIPKLKKYTIKGETNPIEIIECEKTKLLILSTLNAIEGYVMCSCIAIGMLQVISINFSKDINNSSFRFLRTKSNKVVSEATVACFLRKNIFRHIAKNNRFIIPKIIRQKQSETCFRGELSVY